MAIEFEINGKENECCLGTIDDKKTLKILKKAEKNDELGYVIETKDEEINFFDFDNIIHSYGPSLENYYLINSENEEQIIGGEEIPSFCESEPIINNFETEYGYYGGLTVEKGFFGKIKLEDNFNIKQLWVGYLSLEETFGFVDKIVQNFYYITDKEKILKKAKEFDLEYQNFEKFVNEDLENFIEYLNENEGFENFLNEFQIEIEDDSNTIGKDFESFLKIK